MYHGLFGVIQFFLNSHLFSLRVEGRRNDREQKRILLDIDVEFSSSPRFVTKQNGTRRMK